MNGELMSGDEARISVFDHGLLYGDGVFEGIRFYIGRPFRLSEHIDRLMKSAKAIALVIPYGVEALKAAVAETVAAFARPNGYLRLNVTRGVGPMGLDPGACSPPTLFVIAGHPNAREKMFGSFGAARWWARGRQQAPRAHRLQRGR